jgi:hypothetical protein
VVSAAPVNMLVAMVLARVRKIDRDLPWCRKGLKTFVLSLPRKTCEKLAKTTVVLWGGRREMRENVRFCWGAAPD